MMTPERSFLQRCLAVFAGVFLLSFLAGLAIVYPMPTYFSAVAVISVNLPSSTGIPSRNLDSAAFQSESETIRSPEVLKAVIADLHLDQVWPARHFQNLTASDSPARILRCLDHLIKLTQESESNRIEIIVRSTDPEEAAEIANSIVDQYRELKDQEDIRRIMAGGGGSSGGNSFVNGQALKMESPVDDLNGRAALRNGKSRKLRGYFADLITGGHQSSEPVVIVYSAHLPRKPDMEKMLARFLALMAAFYLAEIAVILSEVNRWWRRRAALSDAP